MGYESLIVERRGPVGWLIFDRPERRNAVDVTMFEELERAWLELDADPDVAVIVNTGEGPAFQSGVDLVDVNRNKEALRRFSRQTRDATLRLTAWHVGVTKPVIAAVNGTCAGGGLHFVVDADLVLAAEGVTFLDPHVSVGQATAYEGVGLLRKCSAEVVMRLAMLGREVRLDAERAYRLGIVGEVVRPAERLRERAQELGETMARNDLDAMRATKAMLWRALELSWSDARAEALATLGGSQRGQERAG